MITKILSLFYKMYNLFWLKRRKVEYGTGLKITGMIYIEGKNIRLGRNVRINSCLRGNPIGGDVKTVLRTIDKGKIFIGDNVGISNSSIVSMDSITIEDNVLIGGGCKVYDNDFHPIKFEDRINNNLENIKTCPVIIKKGAFIGAFSIILKGVVVGENSIVGAGSVVTSDVPNNEIWAGNPAKMIKRF